MKTSAREPPTPSQPDFIWSGLLEPIALTPEDVYTSPLGVCETIESQEKPLYDGVNQGGAGGPCCAGNHWQHRAEKKSAEESASELNAAILSTQCQEQEPKLPMMMRMTIWAQQQLDEKVSFPHLKDFGTMELELPVEGPRPAAEAPARRPS